MNLKSKQKGIVVLLLLIATANSLNSQTRLYWGRQYGSTREDYTLNHVIDQRGNIYVSGKTAGIMDDKNYGKNDGFITKIDSLGNKIWTKQFGTSEEEDITWSAIDPHGYVYITGSTTGNLAGRNSGKEDIFVIKFSPDGQIEWSKQFGSDSTDVAQGIYADNKGFIYITGMTTGKLGQTSFGNSDGFLMKLDSNGNKLFIEQFGTTLNDFSTGITGDNKSEIYVCGTTMGNLGGDNKGVMDAYVGYFTDNGELIKFLQFGTDGFDLALQILIDNEMNLYVGGSTTGDLGSKQEGEGDCFLTKINPEGNLEWTKQFGTDKHDGVCGIEFNSKVSDNILISGLLNLAPANSFIRMYKKDGTLLWEKIIMNASGKNVCLDDHGNITHLGLTHGNLFSSSFGEADFFLVKIGLDKGN